MNNISFWLVVASHFKMSINYNENCTMRFSKHSFWWGKCYNLFRYIKGVSSIYWIKISQLQAKTLMNRHTYVEVQTIIGRKVLWSKKLPLKIFYKRVHKTMHFCNYGYTQWNEKKIYTLPLKILCSEYSLQLFLTSFYHLHKLWIFR